jgi:hypothetical protein
MSDWCTDSRSLGAHPGIGSNSTCRQPHASFEQAIAQPDFAQMVQRRDAGESCQMGNIFRDLEVTPGVPGNGDVDPSADSLVPSWRRM